MYLGFASAAAVRLGCEGDPECIFFTLNTYQDTFISYILECDCREWSFFRTHGRTDGRTHGHTDGWTDKRGSRNSYLDLTTYPPLLIDVNIECPLGLI